MKHTLLCNLLLAALLTVCSDATIFSQEQLTYDPNATAESLGLEPYIAPKDFYPVYPWDWFPREIKPYETLETSLSGVAECGFNFAGFIKPEDLHRCDELKLKAMVAISDADWKTMTDEQIDAKIKETVEQSKGHGCVIGYYLTDEPGAKAFPALGKAVAAVKKYDPGKIAYINLFPQYATTDSVRNPNSQLQTKTFAEYLERYVQEVKPQFISYDNYMVEYSDDMQDLNKAAVYYADLLQIRGVAVKYKLPFWNIVSCNRIQSTTPPPSSARFAFQTYTTLAAGGRGLGWFIYYTHPSFSYSPIDTQGRRTVSWQYLQAINKHVRTLGPIMNHLESTGVYFTSPTPTPNLPPLPGKLIKNVESTASPRGNIKEVPAFMVGEFHGDDGHDYAMLVNLSLEHSARFHLETVKTYKKIEWLSPIDGLPTPLITNDSGEWVLPGHGILLKMEME
ncbi:MAG: hypothetical protein LBJ67_07890 [Planctomycetaceae bacterium]|jgi:hypothetical protein|nr:hypothetical protein [Planctomycetaceae bacterium]